MAVKLGVFILLGVPLVLLSAQDPGTSLPPPVESETPTVAYSPMPTEPDGDDVDEVNAYSAPSRTAFSELHDPAFDRYIDLQLLGEAWANLEPGALTDVGLQLAEGERILLRPHKAISANAVLAAAARLCAEKKDKGGLDRLAKAAERLGDKDLAGQVKAAELLAKESRAVDPALQVSVEEMTPESLAFYQQCLLAIRVARLSGNRADLEIIKEDIPNLTEIGETLRDNLSRLTEEALASIPESQSPEAAVLDKLAAASRGGYGPPSSGRGSSGQRPGTGGHTPMGGRSPGAGHSPSGVRQPPSGTRPPVTTRPPTTSRPPVTIKPPTGGPKPP
ncbi:MAG: hypothetical protein K1X57_08450, partial [Gemmataceae bacterium]|nr:hypothetical protein [Gemmataceae bacterium]